MGFAWGDFTIFIISPANLKMLRLVVASAFLIFLLLSSATLLNFQAYGHYDSTTSAEKVTVVIDKLELVSNAKCPDCGKEYPSYENLEFFWRLDSTYHFDHEAGGIFFHQKSNAKYEYDEYLPALKAKGFTSRIVPYFNNENKISQKIWEHTDCKDAENVDVYFELTNMGNPTIKGLTKVTDLISAANKPAKYGGWFIDGIPKIPLPPVIKYGAKIAKALNEDEFLGGTTLTAGPGKYVTEIRTPISEDQQSQYFKIKRSDQKSADDYLGKVSKPVAKVYWHFDVSDLPRDDSCAPKTSVIPTDQLKQSAAKGTAEKSSKPVAKETAKPLPLMRPTTGDTGSKTSADPKPVASNKKPQLSIPKGMTREATSSSGAVVTYSASAQDAEDGAITPTCDRPSGTQFPFGSTVVTCTAKDSNGNSVQGSFTVTVSDTTPPVIDPIQPTEGTKDDSGVIVYFTVTAHDAVDGVVPASCNYVSGTKFPIGVTILTCTADDSKGNHSSRSLQITVTKESSG